MQSFLHSLGESITPVLKNSKFKETGVLTPEEFVAAGDFLVYKCPTWSWASGEETKRRQYLPADKQYLVTKNVPCYQRVKNVEDIKHDEVDVEDEGGDGWVDTFHSRVATTQLEAELKDMTLNDTVRIQPIEVADDDSDDDSDDVPDMDDFEDDNLQEDEESVVRPKEEDNILKTRTYDIYMTYDKYYQTPRMWLYGYDEHGRPLSERAMFEDFSQDHARKTVTMESHPHINLTMASIHPCKHANVMKRIIDNIAGQGREDLPVYMYLMIFLKFVASVIPTIEYDYTRQTEM
ncbi:hypothetical protein SARC_07554 [Sphaeroforma arctica JP610]|uniref:Autophagy-related protein 3 n=1 Tax=Sphaeroforma arctica JP610 TaxID=667725 RepID=A0A0L0FTW5_9EUKA|nr:hypothetical protein SARC_07554 [Sphaeroforma arctica JP610]KNC80084.1 hypothetical protein SARC_07554 [Sphaeroforma arctica JP610]|eukprot:XP_014153986.1 hypothetical protein SARC_07554 [Sphaeroforma arctica JP610]